MVKIPLNWAQES